MQSFQAGSWLASAFAARDSLGFTKSAPLTFASGKKPAALTLGVALVGLRDTKPGLTLA